MTASRLTGHGNDGWAFDEHGRGPPSWSPPGWAYFGRSHGWAPYRGWVPPRRWRPVEVFVRIWIRVTWWGARIAPPLSRVEQSAADGRRRRMQCSPAARVVQLLVEPLVPWLERPGALGLAPGDVVVQRLVQVLARACRPRRRPAADPLFLSARPQPHVACARRRAFLSTPASKLSERGQASLQVVPFPLRRCCAVPRVAGASLPIAQAQSILRLPERHWLLDNDESGAGVRGRETAFRKTGAPWPSQLVHRFAPARSHVRHQPAVRQTSAAGSLEGHRAEHKISQDIPCPSRYFDVRVPCVDGSRPARRCRDTRLSVKRASAPLQRRAGRRRGAAGSEAPRAARALLPTGRVARKPPCTTATV